MLNWVWIQQSGGLYGLRGPLCYDQLLCSSVLMWREVLQCQRPYVKVTAGQGSFLIVSYIYSTRSEARTLVDRHAEDAKCSIQDTGFYIFSRGLLSLKTERQGNMKMRAWESMGGIITLWLVLSKCQREMPFPGFFEFGFFALGTGASQK